MNIRDVLYMRNTGKLRPRASIQDKLLAQKLSGGGVITTATGNPVSIVTNKAQNAISTILSYSPKQTGSGDPSPTNIRPIEGWTEANLFGCGKNLFDKTSIDFPSGTTIKYFPIKVPDGIYTLSTDFPEHENKDVFFLSGNVNAGASSQYNGVCVGYPITRQSIDGYVTVAFRYNSYRENPSDYNYQLELGTTATTYEPYTQGANITANLGGTYYGFSIDLERGVLRVTHATETIDPSRILASANIFIYSISDMMVGNRMNGLCDRFATVGASTSFGVRFGANNSSCYLYKLLDNIPTITDLASCRQWFTDNPTMLAYPLATPLELPLTPQTVALLAGNNTLWTDGDEVSVTYKAKK